MEISGKDRSLYTQELQKGVKLFEAGFKEMTKSKLDPQKQEYEKSMKESLQVIQDSASALMNNQVLKMKEQLDKDYNNYLANPSDANKDKIQSDIDSIKKSTNA